MSIEDKVKLILHQQLGWPIDEINLNQTREQLETDSLDDIEIAMWVEKEFGVDIPDEDSSKWDTGQDIVDYVTKATEW